MDAGKLRSANIQIAALHLKTLLEAEWIEHFMCPTLEEPSHKEIAASVPVRHCGVHGRLWATKGVGRIKFPLKS